MPRRCCRAVPAAAPAAWDPAHPLSSPSSPEPPRVSAVGAPGRANDAGERSGALGPGGCAGRDGCSLGGGHGRPGKRRPRSGSRIGFPRAAPEWARLAAGEAAGRAPERAHSHPRARQLPNAERAAPADRAGERALGAGCGVWGLYPEAPVAGRNPGSVGFAGQLGKMSFREGPGL